MSCRFVLFALSITCGGLPVSGQTYMHLMIEPELFHDIYAQKAQDFIRTYSCMTNDSLQEKLVISYKEGGSIEVLYSNLILYPEKILVFDDRKRLKEWRLRNSASSEWIYFYSYPCENIVNIECFRGDVKKSVSTLKYSSKNRLQEFQQTQIFGPDSIANITYTVRHKGNEMIISEGGYDKKYIMNKRGQLMSFYVGNELMAEVAYNEAGRVISEKYYYYEPGRIEKVMRHECFYSYLDSERLRSREQRVYDQGKVIDIQHCEFNFEY